MKVAYYTTYNGCCLLLFIKSNEMIYYCSAHPSLENVNVVFAKRTGFFYYRKLLLETKTC